MTARPRRDEQGAALILALAFLVMVGALGAVMISSVTSGLNSRTVLNNVRNREYAADGAIEDAIAQVRSRMTTPGAIDPCVAPLDPPAILNSVQIRVNCTFSMTPTLSGLVNRNVAFTAKCESVHQPECPNTDAIIRAQVNFASKSALTASPITVDQTYIQSWSANA